jgi:hypothetical protein
MPVVRINDKGMTVADKRKDLAKKSSLGLFAIGAISIIAYMYISPDAGVMVGLLLPTIASLLNLWSE